MKLVDLDPSFFVGADGEKRALYFLCPCGCGARVGVSLKPKNPNGWTMTGETFETLSLVPSVRVTGGCPNRWHGFITGGQVLTFIT